MIESFRLILVLLLKRCASLHVITSLLLLLNDNERSHNIPLYMKKSSYNLIVLINTSHFQSPMLW